MDEQMKDATYDSVPSSADVHTDHQLGRYFLGRQQHHISVSEVDQCRSLQRNDANEETHTSIEELHIIQQLINTVLVSRWPYGTYGTWTRD